MERIEGGERRVKGSEGELHYERKGGRIERKRRRERWIELVD